MCVERRKYVFVFCAVGRSGNVVSVVERMFWYKSVGLVYIVVGGDVVR